MPKPLGHASAGGNLNMMVWTRTTGLSTMSWSLAQLTKGLWCSTLSAALPCHSMSAPLLMQGLLGGSPLTCLWKTKLQVKVLHGSELKGKKSAQWFLNLAAPLNLCLTVMDVIDNPITMGVFASFFFLVRKMKMCNVIFYLFFFSEWNYLENEFISKERKKWWKNTRLF